VPWSRVCWLVAASSSRSSAVFLTVLHRLMVSGSDRDCERWRDGYRIESIGDLELHHFYRAMARLGGEEPPEKQVTRTLAPRCIKDLVEEQLFARRRSGANNRVGARNYLISKGFAFLMVLDLGLTPEWLPAEIRGRYVRLPTSRGSPFSVSAGRAWSV
jgi:hypothetical protein